MLKETISKKEIHQIIYKIKEMIKNQNPPVVSLVAIKTREPFKILISTILSARTRDEITIKAFEKLFSKVNSVKELADMNIKEIEELIKPVGFYKQKARYLKETAKRILDLGKVPDNVNDIMKLPGVGLKTATLVMIEAFNKNEICVDTHVHRISNRLGIVKTKTPEETYYELKKKLPKKYWKEWNFLLVSFGQSICKPIKPKCKECSIRKMCKYFSERTAKILKNKN